MDENVRWITNDDFCDVKPANVFGKEIFAGTKGINNRTVPEISDKHILFRKKFVLQSTDSTVIHISADDYYRLYINGVFVTSGPAPGYPWHYYYNTVDISGYLHTGQNILAVHTYYQGVCNRVWVSADLRHGLICSILQNDKPVLDSDESFKCAYHTGYLNAPVNVKRHNTSFCEYYDSGAPEVGFEKADFDDSSWNFCKIRANPDYTLYHQDTQQLSYYKIEPLAVVKTKTGQIIDIGREIAGYVSLKACAKKGSVVIIRYAEELNDDGSVMFNTRSNCVYEDKWVLSGGNDVFVPFDYKGIRYVELIYDNDIIPHVDVSIIARHYPFSEAVVCPINDKKIIQIWNLCRDTLKYGTQETFIDCPTREKGQYLGDVCISAVAHAILTGKSDMLKKAITDFAQSSKICDGLMAVSNCSLMQEIADYSMIFPMVLLWYYRLTADKSLIKSMLPVIDGLCRYFRKYERFDGLLENVTEKWNLVDWPQNLRDDYDFELTVPVGQGTHNVINAFYIGMLKSVNRIYDILNIAAIDTNHYEKAYINEFFDNSSDLFKDCKDSCHHSIHSNTLPLLFDIGITDGVKSKIVSMIQDKGLTHSGTYFSFFILQALKNAGESELVLKLIKDDSAWLNMTAQGATATFEAWGKDQKKNCSLFHPWSCAPVLILYDM